MKPPRLPGTEKFRFCDRKFDQNYRRRQHHHQDDADDLDKDMIDATVTTDRSESESEQPYHHDLFDMSHSISTDSLPMSAITNVTETDPQRTSPTSTTTEPGVKNADDTVSTASSSLDELISQVNLNTILRRGHRTTRRKPNLPVTTRVFNLTSYVRHHHHQHHRHHSSNETSDYEEGDEDEEEEEEESDSFSLAASDVKDLRYDPTMTTLVDVCPSGTEPILSPSSASMVANRSPAPTAPANGQPDNLQRSPTTEGSTTIPRMMMMIKTKKNSTKVMRAPPPPPPPRPSAAAILRAAAAAGNLMISAPSHASLMSDESSTSSLSTNTTQDEEDSLLRSSSCSPVLEQQQQHWDRRATVDGTNIASSDAITAATNKNNNNNKAQTTRLSTLSHSSWEEEEEEEEEDDLDEYHHHPGIYPRPSATRRPTTTS